MPIVVLGFNCDSSWRNPNMGTVESTLEVQETRTDLLDV